MHVDEFLKKENREALARELTKEGLFELKEETMLDIDINSLVYLDTLKDSKYNRHYYLFCFFPLNANLYFN